MMVMITRLPFVLNVLVASDDDDRSLHHIFIATLPSTLLRISLALSSRSVAPWYDEFP